MDLREGGRVVRRQELLPAKRRGTPQKFQWPPLQVFVASASAAGTSAPFFSACPQKFRCSTRRSGRLTSSNRRIRQSPRLPPRPPLQWGCLPSLSSLQPPEQTLRISVNGQRITLSLAALSEYSPIIKRNRLEYPDEKMRAEDEMSKINARCPLQPSTGH